MVRYTRFVAIAVFALVALPGSALAQPPRAGAGTACHSGPAANAADTGCRPFLRSCRTCRC